MSAHPAVSATSVVVYAAITGAAIAAPGFLAANISAQTALICVANITSLKKNCKAFGKTMRLQNV